MRIYFSFGMHPWHQTVDMSFSSGLHSMLHVLYVLRIRYNDENVAANLSFILHFRMKHIYYIMKCWNTKVHFYFGSENDTTTQFFLFLPTKRTREPKLLRNWNDTKEMEGNREKKKFTRFISTDRIFRPFHFLMPCPMPIGGCCLLSSFYCLEGLYLLEQLYSMRLKVVDCTFRVF